MAVLLIAANKTGVEQCLIIVVWRGNSVFRNCGCTVDSSKQGMRGAVVNHFLCGQAAVRSGTEAVLFIAASRRGVERC